MTKGYKKAQLAPFIVIGLVILIASSIFLYYRNFTIVEPEVVPEDLMPIKNYVETCLNDVGEDAIVKMGMQGGYIEIPDEIELGDAYIEIIPQSLIKIPYWHYNSMSFIPSIELMQEQLSGYIEENIKKCADLSVFENDYTIEEGDIEVETTINEEDVDIRMTYDIVVIDKATHEQTKVSKYYKNIDVGLKKVYDLGKKILQAENSETYFENMTIDWMSMNPDIPLNGLELHCNELTWRLRDVKRELQDMIYYNLPKVKVENTIYPDFLEDDDVYENLRKYGLREINEGSLPNIEPPADAYDYSHYLIDVRTPKTNLKTGFLYNPDWGMDIVARPSDNGVMRSVKQSGAEEFLSFLCLNIYHFTYDVVYPIEVLIRDDESFNGKGYVFRYAFPVMINHNAADREGFLSKDFFMLGGDFIGECDDLEGPIYDIRVLGVDEYGIANMELKGANISYDCYRFKCDLGKTTADEGAYRLRTQLPSSCAHGFIVAEKENYLDSREQVLDSVDIDVDIKKLKTIEFEAVMNDYNSFSKSIGNDKKIESPFFAIINLQSVDEPSLSFYGRYPFEDDEGETLSLIEQNSRYKLDMMLFDEVDNVLIGGYQGEFTLGYDEIYDGKTIVFHAANYLPKPLNKEAEQNVFKFLDENNIYKDRLKPELR